MFITILQSTPTSTIDVDATRAGHKGAPSMVATVYNDKTKLIGIQVINELGKKPIVDISMDVETIQQLRNDLDVAIEKARDHAKAIAATPVKPVAPAKTNEAKKAA